jgi:hypothetical protein
MTAAAEKLRYRYSLKMPHKACKLFGKNSALFPKIEKPLDHVMCYWLLWISY